MKYETSAQSIGNRLRPRSLTKYVAGGLIVVFALLVSTTQAQVYEEWAVHFDFDHEETSQGVGVDGAGNVFVTGYRTTPVMGFVSWITAKFNADGEEIWRMEEGGREIAVDVPGNWYVTRSLYSESTSSVDFVTSKYDVHGNELWTRFFDDDFDYPQRLAVDAIGNVYVTGHTNDFHGLDQYQCVTLKYDPVGHELWRRYYFETGPGYFSRSLGIDETGNVYVLVSSGASTTVKYDADGNELWVSAYDELDFSESPVALAVSGAGGVYVTGERQQVEPESVPPDFFTASYDADGNEIWIRLYDHKGFADSAVDVAVDSLGNLYVAGSSRDNITGVDYALVKYNADGTEVWIRRYDHAGLDDWPSDLFIDALDNVYVTGTSHDDATGADYATVKYDPDGNELWVRRYDHGDDDSAFQVVVDEITNVYVTGDSVDETSGKDIVTIKYVQGIEPPADEDDSNGEEGDEDDADRNGGGGGGSLDLFVLMSLLILMTCSRGREEKAISRRQEW